MAYVMVHVLVQVPVKVTLSLAKSLMQKIPREMRRGVDGGAARTARRYPARGINLIGGVVPQTAPNPENLGVVKTHSGYGTALVSSAGAGAGGAVEGVHSIVITSILNSFDLITEHSHTPMGRRIRVHDASDFHRPHTASKSMLIAAMRMITHKRPHIMVPSPGR